MPKTPDYCRLYNLAILILRHNNISTNVKDMKLFARKLRCGSSTVYRDFERINMDIHNTEKVKYSDF